VPGIADHPPWTDAVPVHPIGVVRSDLVDPGSAPRQGDEGAPDVWVELHGALRPAIEGIAVGDEVLLLTWFHQADRDQLVTRPRNDPDRAVQGVFSTRSPDRPNPIGLHRVTIRSVDDTRLRVGPCEAIDGTPVVDIKPVLGGVDDR
jgi:tRNA-Thr(GGU) m(6)t(6)A37 methyltransferase TsaA